MLELYHGPVSTASERARFALEEKQLDWTGHLVDLMAGAQHAPAYRALNPKGQVPTLVHDGFVLRESSVITEYLDDAFPQHPLRPRSVRDLARARLWDKTIDEVSARPAAARASALKDKFTFKSALDDEARRNMFRHLAA